MRQAINMSAEIKIVNRITGKNQNLFIPVICNKFYHILTHSVLIFFVL